jgi:hypothetical protein
LASSGNRGGKSAYIFVVALSLAACATRTRPNPEPDLGRYAYLYDDDTQRKAEHELRRECPTLAFGTYDGYPIYLDDGVNRCEAYALAIHYFLKAGMTCGGPDAPVEADPFWLVPMRLGLGGAASLPIRIDKVSGTGRVLYAEGEPSFPPVRSIQTGDVPF